MDSQRFGLQSSGRCKRMTKSLSVIDMISPWQLSSSFQEAFTCYKWASLQGAINCSSAALTIYQTLASLAALSFMLRCFVKIKTARWHDVSWILIARPNVWPEQQYIPLKGFSMHSAALRALDPANFKRQVSQYKPVSCMITLKESKIWDTAFRNTICTNIQLKPLPMILDHRHLSQARISCWVRPTQPG